MARASAEQSAEQLAPEHVGDGEAGPASPVPGRPGNDSPVHVAAVTDERRDDGSQPLIPATIQAHEGDTLILDVLSPHGLARLTLPRTVLTVAAQAPGRACPTVTVSVDPASGGAHPDFVRLTCPPS